MKKINQIEIGSHTFYFEDDALLILENYTARIKELYRDNGEELKVADVESRISEICHERIGEKGIVTAQLITDAINSIGIQIENRQETTAPNTNQEEPREQKDESNEPWYRAMLLGSKIFRNPHNAYIAGVLSGLATYFGTSAALLRILTILLFIVEPVGGIVFITYIVFWIVFPKATSIIDYTRMHRVKTKGSEESIKNTWKENYERALLELEQPTAGGCLPTLVKVLFFLLLSLLAIPFGFLLVAILVIPLSFIFLFIEGNFAGIIALPFVVMGIGLITVAAIIIVTLIYWIIKKMRGGKPMKRWTKTTIIIMLLIALLTTGAAFHHIATLHGGYKNLEQIFTTGFRELTSPAGLSESTFAKLLTGSYTSQWGEYYSKYPVNATGNKVFASIWDNNSGLPFIIESIHNDCGEYNIYFYQHQGNINSIAHKIANKEYDAHYTVNTDAIHGNLYFVWDGENNTLYTDEDYCTADGTRNTRLKQGSGALKIGDTSGKDYNFGNAAEKGLTPFSIFFYADQRRPSLLVGGNSDNEGIEIEPASTYTHIKGLQSPVRATTIDHNGQKDTVGLTTNIYLDQDKMNQTLDDVKKLSQAAECVIKEAQDIVEIKYDIVK